MMKQARPTDEDFEIAFGVINRSRTNSAALSRITYSCQMLLREVCDDSSDVVALDVNKLRKHLEDADNG